MRYIVSWLARLRALFSPRRAAVQVEGACRMSGSCCRNLILVDRGRPLASLRRFRRLAGRDPEFRMFVPREEPTEDGLLRFRCRNLGEDQRCQIYAQRPEFCRDYPSVAMFERGGSLLTGCGYRLVGGAAPSETFEAALTRALDRPNAVGNLRADALLPETGRSV